MAHLSFSYLSTLISHLSFLTVPYSSSPISHPSHLASLIPHLRSPIPSSFISHIPSCISHLSHLLPCISDHLASPIFHLSPSLISYVASRIFLSVNSHIPWPIYHLSFLAPVLRFVADGGHPSQPTVGLELDAGTKVGWHQHLASSL